uniref:Uncharacterized protein LOC111108937 n=1 Tax=Crassostrea virginica TaxID=6565 RepID=A0A8B8BBD2_CRAVI|nr:uncharacterized protein LOC111108937 [Crassostrea virginica]
MAMIAEYMSRFAALHRQQCKKQSQVRSRCSLNSLQRVLITNETHNTCWIRIVQTVYQQSVSCGGHVKVAFEEEIEFFFHLQRCLTDNKNESPDPDLSGTDHYSSQMSASTQESSQDLIESHITPKERLNSAMKILSKDYEPLKHQLSLSWSSICKRSKLYYMKKAREAIHLVLSIIAPGQESILLNAIQPRTEEVDSTTKCVVDAYNHAANSRTQTQILSLIVNNYTETGIQKMMPGVTIAWIDAAEKPSQIFVGRRLSAGIFLVM